jgi:hypothetical protein
LNTFLCQSSGKLILRQWWIEKLTRFPDPRPDDVSGAQLFVFVGIGSFVTDRCRSRCALKEHLAADVFCRLPFDVHHHYTRYSLVCEMCGAADGDHWQTRPTKPVILSLRPRAGDPLVAWTICDECHEGLKGLRQRRLVAQYRKN